MQLFRRAPPGPHSSPPVARFTGTPNAALPLSTEITGRVSIAVGHSRQVLSAPRSRGAFPPPDLPLSSDELAQGQCCILSSSEEKSDGQRPAHLFVGRGDGDDGSGDWAQGGVVGADR
ncbi:hypothetical protein TcYC6_0063490 [Trypanosoma cruzi]|nr:hypothetical protein TcYC6_0063490 [Trypanosoma cruzi]